MLVVRFVKVIPILFTFKITVPVPKILIIGNAVAVVLLTIVAELVYVVVLDCSNSKGSATKSTLKIPLDLITVSVSEI